MGAVRRPSLPGAGPRDGAWPPRRPTVPWRVLDAQAALRDVLRFAGFFAGAAGVSAGGSPATARQRST